MALLTKFIDLVVNPLVQLLLGAAILYFVYGVFTYIRSSESDSGRREGASHILWSTVGLFIMISVFGIMGFIKSVVGGP
jgi:NhaP-type Na+/H+ or K+/H+ antiporter